MWDFISSLISYISDHEDAFFLIFGLLFLISLLNCISNAFKAFVCDSSGREVKKYEYDNED